MCRRYETISPDDFFASPRPLSLLFAWRQWGDEESPVKMVNSKIVSDEGLVETLERLTNTVYSSEHGQRSILRKDVLSPFMDYDKAREKIYRLKKHKILGARAKRLASAFGAN